ncbi:hypothetical protein BDQ12DRAFT_273907 [Crucibulum laeve]|uniref:Uncharacterized protein n=1 Tax=Crucibulum laeve TaxID=68775 RepID=A0A5C3MCE4_9AGAR|nr:hypothetical protein BDQ12DRAFT_273907 [Crucibulum laeve]
MATMTISQTMTRRTDRFHSSRMRKCGQPSTVTRVFIGNPPPPLSCSVVSRSLSKQYIPSCTSESISTCNEQREEADDRSSFTRRLFPVKVSASTLQCTWTTIEELCIKESGNAMTYPAMCFRCGRIPYIPPSATEVLMKLFNGMNYLIPILAVGGLLHDLHLKMFLKWPKLHRLTFLEEVCVGLEVSPLDKMLLTKIFIDDIENLKPGEEDADDDNLNPFQITIAWPSEEAERRLTDPHNPLTLLRQAMNMSSSDEDTYEDIIKIIDTMSKDYLSSLGEDREHDRTELILLSKAIRFKRPSLSRYQEDWPIKFYLSRRAKQLGLPSLPTDKDATSHNDIKMSNSDSTNTIPGVAVPSYPHQIRPVCDVHIPLDLSDISPKMQIYLRNYGMEELTCTLVTAGIQSDDQFERFCEFSKVERRALLQDEKFLRINAFQRIMIDIGF